MNKGKEDNNTNKGITDNIDKKINQVEEITDKLDKKISQVEEIAEKLLENINIEEISDADKMNFYIRLIGLYERLVLSRHAKIDDTEREDKLTSLEGYQKWLRGEIRQIHEVE